jgi:methylenetetrahydrofolate dehydrogenase (NADP+)/methenyltetrahydrofolate cyclohydrolase
MKLLDGKLVSQAVKDDLKTKTSQLREKGGKIPHLAAILVGNNGASETYVASKVKSCEEIGFRSTLTRLEEQISEAELLQHIKQLNDDADVDGQHGPEHGGITGVDRPQRRQRIVVGIGQTGPQQ